MEYLRALRKEENEINEKLEQLKLIAMNKERIMQALHEYNDIKDITQMVLGQLAHLYGVTVTELHRKFNLPTHE